MEQSHFWEANTHPSHPLNKFSELLRHQFHHSVHKNPPPVRVLNQIVQLYVVAVSVISVLILSSNYLSVFQKNCFHQITHHQCVDVNTVICHKTSISILPWFVLELLMSNSQDCERHSIEAKNIFNLRHFRVFYTCIGKDRSDSISVKSGIWNLYKTCWRIPYLFKIGHKM